MIIALTLFSVFSAVQAQNITVTIDTIYFENPANEAAKEKIRNLFEQTISRAYFAQLVDDNLNKHKEGFISVLGESAFETLTVEMKENWYELLKEETANKYTKHFTHDELEEILKFYEGEVGQKLLEKAPLMLQESINMGENLVLSTSRVLMDSQKKKFETQYDIDASQFKEGNFRYPAKENEPIGEATRRNGVQTYKQNGKQMAQYQIEWLSNNTYVLYYINNDGVVNNDLKIEVKIYEINGDSYKYISKRSGKGMRDFYREGEGRKIN